MRPKMYSARLRAWGRPSLAGPRVHVYTRAWHVHATPRVRPQAPQGAASPVAVEGQVRSRSVPARGAQVLAKELQQLAQLSLEVAELAKDWHMEGAAAEQAPGQQDGGSASGRDTSTRDVFLAKLIAQLSHMVAHQARDLAHMAQVLAQETPRTLEEGHAHQQQQEQRRQQQLSDEEAGGFDREELYRLTYEVFRTRPFATRAQLRRMLVDHFGLGQAEELHTHVAGKAGVQLDVLIDRLSDKVYYERKYALAVIREATMREYTALGAYEAAEPDEGSMRRMEPAIRRLLADGSWRDAGGQRFVAEPFLGVVRAYYGTRVARKQRRRDVPRVFPASLHITLEELAFIELGVYHELAGLEAAGWKPHQRKRELRNGFEQLLQDYRQRGVAAMDLPFNIIGSTGG